MSAYLNPIFGIMSQIGEHLNQASLQQKQLDAERDRYQSELALRKQQVEGQQNESIASMLQSGGKSVDANGNVSVPAPQGTWAKGPDGNLHQQLMDGAPVPLPADRGQVVSIGGRQIQVPTADQTAQRDVASKTALSRVGKITIPDETADDLGIQRGTLIDPDSRAFGDIIARKYATDNKPAPVARLSSSNPELQARETAASVIAGQGGMKLDPTKSAFEQLTPQQQIKAIGMAKEASADPEARADRRALVQSTLSTQGLQRQLAEQGLADKKKAAQDKLDAGAQLNSTGKKSLESIEPVIGQTDQLLTALEAKDKTGRAYKENNNPLALAAPALQYKAGIKSPEGELGTQIGNLSLQSLQAAAPFTAKTRNYQYVKQIQQHTPKMDGLTPDSPALVYGKLQTIQRNFLRMRAGTMRYETQKTSTNPAAPSLTPDDAQRYYHLALAGRDPKQAQDAPALAAKLAQEDGWQVPTMEQ